MSEPPLFPGYTDGTVQWRAELLQLVNWGGFEGHHEIGFDADTTLIAGPTGSGKSTVLDAYTALMMPSRVPFNSASNEATTGRARSLEQRSVLTYLRGKLDTSQDATGTRTDQIMRGRQETVWGGVCMTFRADDGRRFTAIRVYLATPSMTRDSEVLKRIFTLAGPLDLREFHDLHASRFQAHTVKAAFPGIEAHDDNYTAFSDELFRRLGIAGGLKALELLARVQAGKQVTSVTSLFTELVLDRPQTYEMADRAIGHFGDLERLYETIATDAAKQQQLEPMIGLHEQYAGALAEVERLDTFGVRHPIDQPFDLWATRYQLELCRQATRQNRADNQQAAALLQEAKAAVALRDAERGQAESQLRTSGGDAVNRLKDELEQARVRVGQVIKNRAAFAAQTSILGVAPSTADTYAELRSSAEPFLRSQEAAAGTLNDAVYMTRRALEDQAAERDELNDELESLKSRDGLVPVAHDRARRQIAAACGLQPSELPFAAELIDLRPECEEWRLAAEVTLRGVGLTMLMDERRQAQIRQRIDPLELGLRLQFDGVELADMRAEPEDPDYISGRLRFKEESPFVWWVKRRVYEEDHLCVDSPSELGGEVRKVTRNGQTSRGTRGAHGRARNFQNILGFSNEARRREIKLKLAELELELAELATKLVGLAEDAKKLEFRRRAYEYVKQHTWDEIDVDGAESRVTELDSALDALLKGNDQLAQLEKLAQDARDRHEEAIAKRTIAEQRVTHIQKAWEQLIDDEDSLVDVEILTAAKTTLTDEVSAALSERLAQYDNEVVLYGPSLVNTLRRLRTELKKDLDIQDKRVQDFAASLARIFSAYDEKWPDPNRGTEVESYAEYEEVYTGIVGAGLYERKSQFQRKVTEWASQDLIQLQVAYGDAAREVERRLKPINETLSHLPFGAGRDRLSITMRERRPESVRDFLTELRGLTDRLTDDLTYEAAEDRYRRLLTFMNQLRAGDAERPGRRDALLDVRRHIEITARRNDIQGNELSTYTTLAGMSGGESQELVAFIAGAALRFQLADDTERRPRFAPVFLDEGFVKADSEHAGRAVEAWRELGFQLILAVPLDKVTGLDRHIKLRLSVNKHGEFSRVTELREHRQAPAA